jgi:hypothetical protein
MKPRSRLLLLASIASLFSAGMALAQAPAQLNGLSPSPSCYAYPFANVSPLSVSPLDTLSRMKCDNPERSITIERFPKRMTCTLLNQSGSYLLTEERVNDLRLAREQILGRIQGIHPGTLPLVTYRRYGELPTYFISFQDRLGCRHVDVISLSGPDIIHSRLLVSSRDFSSEFLQLLSCLPKTIKPDCASAHPAAAAIAATESTAPTRSVSKWPGSRRILRGGR